MSWSERRRNSSRGSLRSSRQALHDDRLNPGLIENWKELGQLLLHPCIALPAAAEDVLQQVLDCGRDVEWRIGSEHCRGEVPDGQRCRCYR